MNRMVQRPRGPMLAMRADVATARVVSRLRDAGIPSLVLKGPAIDRWLYTADGPRVYGDADVLVPPLRFADACSEMERMGLAQSAFPSPSRHAEHFDPPAGSAMAAV